MHLILLSIVAMCVAVIHGQPPMAPAGAVITDPSTTMTTTTTDGQTEIGLGPMDQDGSDDGGSSFGHEHRTHHEHDATITIDVHNILDLFKQQLRETEDRILAAIQRSPPGARVASLKSYRIGDR